MRKRKVAVVLGLAAALTVVMAAPALAQEPTPEQLEVVTDTQFILDNIFIFIAGVLVLFMQAGFAMLTAGLSGSKSVANILMKNMMDACLGILVFGLIGYHIGYSGSSFLGFDWAWGAMDSLEGVEGNLMQPVDFFFQAAFAAAAATIVAGAMAGRTKFVGYLAYTVVITAFIYPVVVGWTWGGGWLAERGFEDFAGSTIVHSVGGWAALMGAFIVGPRLGKYTADGRPRAIPGHSMPLVVIGVFILWVGWYGFNPGSQLAADIEVPRIALTTTFAAVAGGATAMLTSWVVSRKPDVSMAGNGILGGLVSITAGAYALTNWGALIAGAIGGVLVVGSVLFIDRVLKVDDPAGAISVHGTCGAWGTIAVGLLANPAAPYLEEGSAGLFHGGGADLLVDQVIGVVAVFAWVAVAAGALFFVLRSAGILRASDEEQRMGLDVSEHGSPGYGEMIGFDGGPGSGTGYGVPSPQTT